MRKKTSRKSKQNQTKPFFDSQAGSSNNKIEACIDDRGCVAVSTGSPNVGWANDILQSTPITVLDFS